MITIFDYFVPLWQKFVPPGVIPELRESPGMAAASRDFGAAKMGFAVPVLRVRNQCRQPRLGFYIKKKIQLSAFIGGLLLVLFIIISWCFAREEKIRNELSFLLP